MARREEFNSGMNWLQQGLNQVEEKYISKVTRLMKDKPAKDMWNENPISGDELRRVSGETYTGRKKK